MITICRIPHLCECSSVTSWQHLSFQPWAWHQKKMSGVWIRSMEPQMHIQLFTIHYIEIMSPARSSQISKLLSVNIRVSLLFFPKQSKSTHSTLYHQSVWPVEGNISMCWQWWELLLEFYPSVKSKSEILRTRYHEATKYTQINAFSVV